MKHVTFCLYAFLNLSPWIASAGPDVVTHAAANGDTKDIDVSSSVKPHLMGEFKHKSGSGEWLDVPPATAEIRPEPYAPYKVDPDIFIKREVCNNAGECAEAELRNDWAGLGYNRQEYDFMPGSRIRTALRCAKGKWTVQLGYAFEAINAGHSHFNIPFPLLAINVSTASGTPAQWQETPSPVAFPEMQKNTTYYFWTQLPIFSATLEEKFSASGACSYTRTDSIRVGFIDLIPLPGTDQWYYPDSYPTEIGYAHTDSHFGTPKLIDAITSIAKEYREVFPKAGILNIYHMSLPYGGIIDINRDWKRPFYGHSTGIDADISKRKVPFENRKKLLEIMCGHADTYSEQAVPGQTPYFHIRVADSFGEGGIDDFGGISETTIKCCNGTSVNPMVVDICISTQTSTW